MTGSARFELFAYWRTSATYRVRVAMNLKSIAVDERLVDLDAGEQRGEAFLKVNPLGAIPALIDREAPAAAPITQSLAILEFLEEVRPTPPLLPADAHGRARVRSLAAMLAADTHPLLPARVAGYLSGTAGLDAGAIRAWRTHWLTTGLQAFEQRLATEAQTGAYCHGDQLGMADICLASLMIVLPLFGIEVADIPTVNRIFAACEAHEAFAKAQPMRQAGAPAG